MDFDARFPAMNAFIAGLPDGLASHPQCSAKATLYRTLSETMPLQPDELAAMPAPLRELIERPAPVSSWIPEVYSHAIMLSIYDRRFTNLASFADHAYKHQRRLFEGPLYAVAFRIITPALVVKTSALRWRMFHRGMKFIPNELSPGHGQVRLEYPHGVYEAVLRRALCEALRAALDMTNGGGNTVLELEASRTHAVLDVHWRLP
ncbi:MAG: hypothetical protein AAF721_38290 [Myxococcota bacterium]